MGVYFPPLGLGLVIAIGSFFSGFSTGICGAGASVIMQIIWRFSENVIGVDLGDGDLDESSRRVLAFTSILSIAQYPFSVYEIWREPKKSYRIDLVAYIFPGINGLTWLGSYLAVSARQEYLVLALGCLLISTSLWQFFNQSVLNRTVDDAFVREKETEKLQQLQETTPNEGEAPDIENHGTDHHLDSAIHIANGEDGDQPQRVITARSTITLDTNAIQQSQPPSIVSNTQEENTPHAQFPQQEQETDQPKLSRQLSNISIQSKKSDINDDDDDDFVEVSVSKGITLDDEQIGIEVTISQVIAQEECQADEDGVNMTAQDPSQQVTDPEKNVSYIKRLIIHCRVNIVSLSIGFFIGCFCGLLGGVFGVQSAPLVMYFTYLGLTGTEIRDTCILIFLTNLPNLIASRIIFPIFLLEEWFIYVMSLPITIIGLKVGWLLHKHVPSRQILTFLQIIIFLSSVPLVKPAENGIQGWVFLGVYIVAAILLGVFVSWRTQRSMKIRKEVRQELEHAQQDQQASVAQTSYMKEQSVITKVV